MKRKRLDLYILLIALTVLPVTAARHKTTQPPLVTPLSQSFTPCGALQGTHLAIWNSHGLYYNQTEGQWRWQRARLLGTVEDLHTTDYVLSYLVPMLEHAGACVLLPRERDTNPIEIIIDNDDDSGLYAETGEWQAGADAGFAHLHECYTDGMNPFEDGSYRQCTSNSDTATAAATWNIPIEKSGSYAVYVAYHSSGNSATDAHYTVCHAGGRSSYAVNQTMGGGTWIYLGTHEFTPESDNRIILSNHSSQPGSIVTADAVKVGGGMGNIARKPCLNPRKPTKEALNNLIAQRKRKRRRKSKAPAKASVHTATTSGYPRYTEAARYWMQWAGVPDTIYSDTGGDNDYNDDLRGRGYWLNYLCGGSAVLPDSVGLNIPIDAAVAFHSDAGNEEGDSIVGSMGIYYTGKRRSDRRFANGVRRTESQKLARCILDKIACDAGSIQPHWTMRKERDRRYAEARLGEVPTLLLESMSHQNFTDMRYGLDPRFKFLLSRAVYKGILQYLSQRNGTPYIVQPLPVSHIELHWKGTNQVELTWKSVTDPAEESAQATCYKVYTRRGEYGWDNGTVTEIPEYSMPLQADVTYSFYVTALNDGGESFPSETLSARRVQGAEETVLIINAFDRVSAPLAVEDSSRTFAGFRYDIDGGVPYRHTVAYTGEQYEFDRRIAWKSDDDPGFGASKGDYEGMRIAGNTFDYPIVHGEAIAGMGYSYISASDEAVADGRVNPEYYPYVDVILGKERTTMLGNDTARCDYTCFTPAFMEALARYCDSGGRLLISGAYAGRDIWNSGDTLRGRIFASRVLHYRWDGSYNAHGQASVRSIVPGNKYPAAHWKSMPNEHCYAVEETDVLFPEGEGAATFMIYEDFRSAAVAYSNGIYKCCTLGFPLEAIDQPQRRVEIMREIFRFFNRKHTP